LLEAGNVSANGNYITYNPSVRVDSREIMDKIDAELRAIESVKMVL
jgi:putative lipoic acid-binding regulatory protein